MGNQFIRGMFNMYLDWSSYGHMLEVSGVYKVAFERYIFLLLRTVERVKKCWKMAEICLSKVTHQNYLSNIWRSCNYNFSLKFWYEIRHHTLMLTSFALKNPSKWLLWACSAKEHSKLLKVKTFFLQFISVSLSFII